MGAEDSPPQIRLVPTHEPNPTTDVLLQRIARGDQQAFTALYDLLAGRVYGLARRILRDPSHAEEVTQDVFVHVWRHAAAFDATRGTALGWIFTIAHRRAVDRVRSAQATSERERRGAAMDSRDEERGYDVVSEQVETRLEHERLRHCLGSLTTLQLESINLAYYRGFTYREVAELLRIPVGTVKTRMRDGLIRLRDCLGMNS